MDRGACQATVHGVANAMVGGWGLLRAGQLSTFHFHQQLAQCLAVCSEVMSLASGTHWSSSEAFNSMNTQSESRGLHGEQWVPKEGHALEKALSFIQGRAQSFQLCPTLCDPMDYSAQGFPVHRDSPGNNTGVGCHALL